MVQLNFGHVEEIDPEAVADFAPPGEYICEVIAAKQNTSDAGIPSFRFGLKVVEGEHEKSLAAFDGLYFTNEKAYEISKYKLKRLGFDVSGDLDVEASDLNGRFVVVKTEPDPSCPECKGWTKRGETKGMLVCQKLECGKVFPVAAADMSKTKVAYGGYKEYTGEPRQPSGDGTDFDPAKIEAGGGKATNPAEEVDF